MISDNVPMHLVIGARTGFLNARATATPQWRRIAQEMTLEAKSTDLVDLGDAPMPAEDNIPAVKDFIEKTINIQPKNWHITVWLSYNAIKDDKTGTLEGKVRSASENFDLHLDNQVFKALDGGDGATYGLCYDGLYMFSNSHYDKGAEYQTVQDNMYGLTLSLDNFTTVYVASQQYRGDNGEFKSYVPDLLVVPPALEYTAAQICGNREAYDTANRELNPYAGKLSYIVNPQLASTAWFLAVTNKSIKPIIVGMREQAGLQSAWFDPKQPDGGRYYFKFYARYNTAYGDWRLCTMGNT